MPKPGSQRGYQASTCVTPLVLMLTGGGRSLEDLRTLKNDTALRHLIKQGVLPSTDAAGDWLHRTEAAEGLVGLDRINRGVVATRLRQTGLTAHTLNGDASQIVAEKEAAQFTYKGTQGYMPMIGHFAEAGIVIFDEFREGNIAPATRNLAFIQACEARLRKGHRIAHVCLDSAGYQFELFDDAPKYRVIVSNRAESTADTLIWFGLIAHNLFVLFKHSALGTDWQRHQVATVRWRLFHLLGKVVRHAGSWLLKVAADTVDLFRSIRARSFAQAVANSP